MPGTNSKSPNILAAESIPSPALRERARVKVKMRNNISRIEDRSKVQKKTVLSDSPDDRRMAHAKSLRDSAGAEFLVRNNDDHRRQLFGRQRAAADLGRTILQADAESVAESGLNFGQHLLAHGPDVVHRAGEGF